MMPEVCEPPKQNSAPAPSRCIERLRFWLRPRWWVIVPLVAVAAAVGAWYGGLKQQFVPKKFAAVVPGRIYRSGQISARLIGNVLDEHDIRLVIDMNGEDPSDADQRAELRAVAERGIELKRFPLRGNGTGDIHRYADALAELHRAERDGRPVLIHCHAGASRTGAAVAFYRLFVQHRDPVDVWAEMQDFFPDLTPQSNLTIYMNARMRTLAELLVERGVISHVPATIPQLGR